MKKQLLAAIAMAGLLLPTACSDSNSGWSISGDVEGRDTTMVLEGFNNGRWYVVDTITITKGNFKYTAPQAAAYPEIMRLTMGERHIYFPVDSTDVLTLRAKTDNFGDEYSLEGTPAARSVRAIDSLLSVAVAQNGTAATASDSLLKAQLFARAFADPSVVSLYYLINKSVGDTPLYNLSTPSDLRYYGAVAQRFATVSPDDPRGEFLSTAYRRARAAASGVTHTLDVPQQGLIDIVRSDSRGNSCSLSEIASEGKVVVLSFTNYSSEFSPSYNVLLNEVYEKYAPQGVEIYQIAFDSDETAWKQTARNLPWTCVWNGTTGGASPLASYNVTSLPTTFVIDRQGTLRSRVDDPTKLAGAVVPLL